MGETVADPNELKYKKLRQFNLVMGCLHLFQAALMLFLSNSFTLSIVETLQRYQPPVGTDPGYFYSVTNTVVDVPIGPLVAMFLLVSAIAHFSVSLTKGGYEWYVKNLSKGINPARWYEYAISSSIMIVLIAMLCGITELSALMALFALNATMNLFGMMMELHNQTTKKTDWTAFIYGSFAGLVCWIVLGVYFFGAVLSSSENVPTFVYAIFFSLAFFFNIFAVNMILQYRGKGKYADYLHGERVYIILSLVAKSLLAWQVFAGTLRGG